MHAAAAPVLSKTDIENEDLKCRLDHLQKTHDALVKENSKKAARIRKLEAECDRRGEAKPKVTDDLIRVRRLLKSGDSADALRELDAILDRNASCWRTYA